MLITHPVSFLTESNPELKGWLPDKGGIFYSADMFLFYQTFFKNPKADWRYMIGFEPTLMPADDLKNYNLIMWNYGGQRGLQRLGGKCGRPTVWQSTIRPAGRRKFPGAFGMELPGGRHLAGKIARDECGGSKEPLEFETLRLPKRGRSRIIAYFDKVA